jgi:hypothetical protein
VSILKWLTRSGTDVEAIALIVAAQVTSVAVTEQIAWGRKGVMSIVLPDVGDAFNL